VLTRFSTAFQKSGRVPDFFSEAICSAPDRRQLRIGKATFPHRFLADEESSFRKPVIQGNRAGHRWPSWGVVDDACSRCG